jgi:hypothetical protein
MSGIAHQDKRRRPETVANQKCCAIAITMQDSQQGAVNTIKGRRSHFAAQCTSTTAVVGPSHCAFAHQKQQGSKQCAAMLTPNGKKTQAVVRTLRLNACCTAETQLNQPSGSNLLAETSRTPTWSPPAEKATAQTGAAASSVCTDRLLRMSHSCKDQRQASRRPSVSNNTAPPILLHASLPENWCRASLSAHHAWQAAQLPLHEFPWLAAQQCTMPPQQIPCCGCACTAPDVGVPTAPTLTLLSSPPDTNRAGPRCMGLTLCPSSALTCLLKTSPAAHHWGTIAPATKMPTTPPYQGSLNLVDTSGLKA